MIGGLNDDVAAAAEAAACHGSALSMFGSFDAIEGLDDDAGDWTDAVVGPPLPGTKRS